MRVKASAAAQAQTQRPVLGAALRLLAIAALGVMFALVKWVSTRGVHLAETLFYRQFFALPIVLLWVATHGGLATLRTQRIGAHTRRMMVGLTGMTLNFAAMLLLPLAVATTVGLSVPIFATLLAALLLGERTGWPRWSAVIVGFVGVLIVLRPDQAQSAPLGMAVAIGGALTTAAVTILIRDLGRTETAHTTVFWFSLLSLIPLAPLAVIYGGAHDAVTWGLIAAMGLAGGIGQLALTAALRFAPVAVVVPMDYSSLLWGLLLGWWLFGEWPGPSLALGAPLIIGSGLFILWREQRLALARARDVEPGI